MNGLILLAALTMGTTLDFRSSHNVLMTKVEVAFAKEQCKLQELDIVNVTYDQEPGTMNFGVWSIECYNHWRQDPEVNFITEELT